MVCWLGVLYNSLYYDLKMFYKCLKMFILFDIFEIKMSNKCMANVYSYTFFNPERIGLDQCCQSQNDIQNVEACSYMTQNYFASDCTMKVPQQLAYTQPGIFLNGGFGSSSCGSNIDESSKLLIGTIQTHPKCRISLFQRPFSSFSRSFSRPDVSEPSPAAIKMFSK